MLVLSRQRDQSLMIGDNVEVTVVDIRGDKVRLGVNSPREISVHRKEVYDAIIRENLAARRVLAEDLIGMTRRIAREETTANRLPFDAIENLQAKVDLSIEQLARIAGVAQLDRCRARGRFSADESVCIERMAKVADAVRSKLSHRPGASMRWLLTPRAIFNGKSALEFSVTDIGLQKVEDAITLMECDRSC